MNMWGVSPKKTICSAYISQSKSKFLSQFRRFKKVENLYKNFLLDMAFLWYVFCLFYKYIEYENYIIDWAIWFIIEYGTKFCN